MRPRRSPPVVDLSTAVGDVALANPVMTASGTAGHGAELGAYMDLGRLGAVVSKSVGPGPWPGNPPPRVRDTPAGMINSVGLQGPGVDRWIAEDLGPLREAGATVVASIWGRTVEEFAAVAERLASVGEQLAAVEVNLSCPNTHRGRELFAQDPDDTAAAVRAAIACGRPLWAKLTANASDVVAVAAAAWEAGAEAVTLINTVLGMCIDVETRRPSLGGGGGGLSGRAIHPIAVRTVYDVHAALPELPIVGVGGVTTGEDAVELLLAGASAVQVGTATFADPRAAERVRSEVEAWCAHHDVSVVRELIGGAHG